MDEFYYEDFFLLPETVLPYSFEKLHIKEQFCTLRLLGIKMAMWVPIWTLYDLGRWSALELDFGFPMIHVRRYGRGKDESELNRAII